MQIQGPRPQKNWSFVGYFDAACNLEPHVMRELACFQEIDPQDVHVVMQVNRKIYHPPAPKDPRLEVRQENGQMKKAGLVQGVSAVASFTAAGVLLSYSPIAAVAAGGVGAIAAYAAAKSLMQVKPEPPPAPAEKPLKAAPPIHHEPDWEGLRTLELTGSKERSKFKLDSPTLHEAPVTKLNSTDLGNSIADMLGQFPSRHSMVVLGAHGNTYRGWAGLSTEQLADALRVASEKRGDKLDMVFFESCLMANLEGLSKLAPYARYVVASEEVIYTGDRAWGLVMNDLGGAKADSPEQLGKTIVKALGAHWETRTMSLIDLSQLAPLKDSVEALARNLKASPERASIEEALDVRIFGSTQLTDSIGVADLGDMLDRLQEGCKDPKTLEAVKKAQDCLDKAVVANQNQMCYDHAHGLSIHGATHQFNKVDYVKRTGMKDWGDLLESFRPMPRDRTIVNHSNII